MASLAIHVAGISAPGPHDAVCINAAVHVEGSPSSFTIDVFVPFDSSSCDINMAIVDTAVARAVALGHDVGPSDKRRLFGGAVAVTA